MLRIDLTPHEDTRTPERSCVYRAQAIIAGVTYEAHARLGASNALARHLVAEGIADSPVRVFQDGHRGYLQYASLHTMALWTIEEGRTGLRRVRWHDPGTVFGGGATAKHEGERDDPHRSPAAHPEARL